jgi:16S rRNA (guanine527-N7)-methyltransferase
MTALSAAWLEARLAIPARDLGVVIPEVSYEPLARYASLVLEWGARINLTGARTPAALADDHLADALAMLSHLPDGPFRFVDVGSGAGLPGIPIALLRPDASGVLLEPVGKKHVFLAHAIRALGLSGRLEARSERLEQHLVESGRGAYDVAVSRAVWKANEWLALGEPLLKRAGVLLGVEGSTAGELPPGATRHPYRLQGRLRAVIARGR